MAPELQLDFETNLVDALQESSTRLENNQDSMRLQQLAKKLLDDSLRFCEEKAAAAAEAARAAERAEEEGK